MTKRERLPLPCRRTPSIELESAAAPHLSLNPSPLPSPGAERELFLGGCVPRVAPAAYPGLLSFAPMGQVRWAGAGTWLDCARHDVPPSTLQGASWTAVAKRSATPLFPV